MNKKLKTCPFCGGKAIHNKECSWFPERIDCENHCLVFSGKNCIEKWNTRNADKSPEKQYDLQKDEMENF